MGSIKTDEEWRSNDGDARMEEYQPGSEAEKKLVRKMDFRIVGRFPLAVVNIDLSRVAHTL